MTLGLVGDSYGGPFSNLCLANAVYNAKICFYCQIYHLNKK